MSFADASCQVLCTGLIVADHVAAPIPRLPPSGGLVSTPRTQLTIGGCGANVAVDLVKLGISASYVGCVGDDVLGRFCRDELQAAGVGCEGLVFSRTSQTATTLVINVQGEDRRFIHAPGANAELTGREIGEAMLSACRVLYVGGIGMNPALSGENVAELFSKARSLGVRTVLDVVVSDPTVMADMLAPVLPLTDVFLPNTDEARLITGLDDSLAQARHFRSLGAQTVVVTCGGNGAVLVHADDPVRRCGAHAVEQIDGTGGGDAFAAGLIFGLLEGCELPRCLEYGAALGASCVQSPGATTGTFTEPQLRSFLQSHPLTIDSL
jgi:sugar/nucleoside kinase (ribokinase family)